MSRAERLALVEREDPALPISQQCRLLAISRSAVYRRPAEVGEADLAIMALMDRQYLARSYYGRRRMAAWLATAPLMSAWICRSGPKWFMSGTCSIRS
jgi:hypothetical protein